MPNKTQPKDIFIQLLAIITLYISAISFITLLFQIINVIFPDPLNYYYNPGGAIRWALSSLVVIFPVLVWISRFLYKDLAANPEKAEFRLRKWLIYFTLFAAAVIILGDLITLIYNFLEGDLTVRFILKILVVLGVVGSVFWYYLYDLRRKPKEFSRWAKVFVWKIIILVTAAAIISFFIAGSPFKQRALRFDQERLGHLQNIQWQIVNYWTQKGKLPGTLDDLTDSISGFVSPQDPETGEAYLYKIMGNYSFELCANFNFSSKESRLGAPETMAPERGLRAESWDHGVGQQCFERTIDPELYKINKPQ